MIREIDVLVRGGLVFDGKGGQPFEADIAVAGERILYIAKAGSPVVAGSSPRRILDARSLAVSPGFIDVHAHSEFTALADPRMEGKVCQGVTTEINGNCGLSAAPLFGPALEQRQKDLEEYGISERWRSFREYFFLLEARRPAANFVSLAGHGNIRACVAGYKDGRISGSELNDMTLLLLKAVEEGAAGLSTGLIYPPGIFSDEDELVFLCSSMRENAPYGDTTKCIYATHMRSEGDRLIESVAETIRIGRRSGLPVHISHIKTSGEKNWQKAEEVVHLIDEAREYGVPVTCDRYPYTASSTDLDSILPSWTFEGGAARELLRLRTPDTRKRISEEVRSAHPEASFWNGVHISSLELAKNKWMEGRSIASISSEKGWEPVPFLLELLSEEELRVGGIFHSMSEENLLRFLSLPYVMIGTDSSARTTDGTTCRGKVHPRGFGSFPRFLSSYVREKRIIEFAEAIRKISFLPAATFGIAERGVVEEGAYADLVIFDIEKIADRATYREPFLRPQGIHAVFINGVQVVSGGEMTGARSGKVLRRGRAV
jgi:N-acyl-D-amino-acid deacylase